MGKEKQEGILNCCCPYLGIAECKDTKEHKHPICRVMKEPIPNEKIAQDCVTDYGWRKCVYFGIADIGVVA